MPTEKAYNENSFCGYCDDPLPPRENGISQWSSESYAGLPVWLCVKCHFLERCETNPDYAQKETYQLNNEGKCIQCYLPLSAHDNEQVAECLSLRRMKGVRSWIDSLRQTIAKGAVGWTTEADIEKYRRIVENADPRFK